VPAPVALPVPDVDSHAAANDDTRANMKAGASSQDRGDVLFATCGADDVGGLNAVVIVGPEALLFLWLGYADPAPRARPAPRFDVARGLAAETLSALLLASSRACAASQPAPGYC